MKIIKYLSAITLALAMLVPGAANATLLTFDDIPGGSIQNHFGRMPVYKGFNFNPISNLDWIDTVGSRWNFGAHSGDFTLLNNFSGTAIITASDLSDFTFDGLWAKRWGTAPDSGGADTAFGSLAGFNNGAAVWTVDTPVNGSFKFFAAQTGAIDELRLGFGDSFMVDDICLNCGQSPSVPEPAPLALLGLGLLGLGLARRRRA